MKGVIRIIFPNDDWPNDERAPTTKELLSELSKQVRTAQVKNNRRAEKERIPVDVIEINDVLYRMRQQLGWLRREEKRLRQLERSYEIMQKRGKKPQNKMAGRNRLRV